MIDLLQHFATQDRWNYELQENSLVVVAPPIVYVFESPTNETFLFPIFSHFDVKYLHVHAMMSKFYLNVFLWKWGLIKRIAVANLMVRFRASIEFFLQLE